MALAGDSLPPPPSPTPLGNPRARPELRQAGTRNPPGLALWLYPRVMAWHPSGQAGNRAPAEAGQAGQAAQADQATRRAGALLLLETRKFPEASAALSRLKRADPAGATAVLMAYLKGKRLPGRPEGLAAPVERSLPSLPDELELAQALVAAKEPDLARVVLQEAAASFPDSSQAHGELGLLLSSQSQYPQATRELERAAGLEPQAFRYSLGLAEAMLASKHNFTALQFLQSVQSRFQALPEYQYVLALAYYDCYRYPEAISGFESVARAEPQMDRVPFLIGNCYMALGELEKAQEFYRQAIAMQPREPTYRAALGKMLRMQGRMDEAIPVLEAELELAPLDAQSRYHLALCYEAKGNFAQAQRLLEQIAAQKPAMLTAHVALARVYYHNGFKEK
ncbi:MAG TPA: tetratricopeptide repeat protein, partial [Terriglobia bacterium]|nr:tetratricopeptide repeat protein [Terriglobia bacterium]